MIDETIKRLIDPSGPGHKILTALWTRQQDDDRPRVLALADLVRATHLSGEEVKAVVYEMSGAGLVQAVRDQVQLGWLGTIWMPELEDARLLGIAHFMRLPLKGVTQHLGGRNASVRVDFDERTVWLLVEALDIAIKASARADKERFLVIRTVLQKHQDQLLMVAEGDAEPGEHFLRDDDLASWFDLPAATSARC